MNNKRHFLIQAALILIAVILALAVRLAPIDDWSDKTGNRYEPTQRELEWACNENRETKRNREGYERVLIKCLSGVPSRSVTGTDDQSDIVEECRISASAAYRVHGYYTNAEIEALNRTYKDCTEDINNKRD